MYLPKQKFEQATHREQELTELQKIILSERPQEIRLSRVDKKSQAEGGVDKLPIMQKSVFVLSF